VRILDRNAEALGVPTAQLMEAAGKAVAEEARALGKGPYLVLAGPGNNGGDGLVAARHLAKHGKVTVALATPRKDLKELARAQLKRLTVGKVVEVPSDAQLTKLLGQAGLVVDALLGVGVQGTLREPYRTWVLLANEHAPAVLSVDVPTGLGTDLAVEPDATVTFHEAKEGMTEGNSGRIVVRDIGIPPRARTHTGPGELLLYPLPKPEQHKGEGGVVLVLGGGPYTGAPALTALAALRTGADLAIVLTPTRAADTIASYSPDLIVRALNGYDLDLEHPDNLVVLEEFLPRAGAVCIGNGMGRADRALRSVALVLERLAQARLPVVVDADAIHGLAQHKPTLRRDVVVTPHAGEFRALTGEALAPEDEPDKRVAQARAAARALGCTLVVKGHASVITDGQRVKLNSTGNPAMSHGGSGDVLAGAIGALLAKGLDPFDAGRLGAWLCGRAGDLAFEEQRFGLLASDQLQAIPRAFREAGLHWRP
jgi:NAD(P)H-hydrate epimerase